MTAFLGRGELGELTPHVRRGCGLVEVAVGCLGECPHDLAHVALGRGAQLGDEGIGQLLEVGALELVRQQLGEDIRLRRKLLDALGVGLGAGLAQAVELSQAKEFVDKLPDGTQHHVAQMGRNMSGGQKQRLSIARALARKPEILVFDDSFSALDYRTDAKLREGLSKQLHDTTKIIVAQRISTIRHADKIIVLDRGETVGIGTHEELMKNCDVYREIATSQLSAAELA